jgi:hypothetical protein
MQLAALTVLHMEQHCLQLLLAELALCTTAHLFQLMSWLLTPRSENSSAVLAYCSSRRLMVDS